MGLARLAVPVTLAAQIGEDADGQMLAGRLQQSGVAVESLPPRPARTSSAEATLNPDGSARYALDLTWNPVGMPDPSEFAAVHVGSLGTALAPGAELVAELVGEAHAAGVPVTFDPNVRLAVLPDPMLWRAVFDRVVPFARVVKMSNEDAAALFPDESATVIARRLARGGVIAAVTLGGDGAVLCGGGEVVVLDPVVVDVVDTIGAGDTFMAAMLAWLSERGWPTVLTTDDLESLGSFAAATASVTCSRAGADPPWRSEL